MPKGSKSFWVYIGDETVDALMLENLIQTRWDLIEVQVHERNIDEELDNLIELHEKADQLDLVKELLLPINLSALTPEGLVRRLQEIIVCDEGEDHA